jgi:precorrin-3B synthase
MSGVTPKGWCPSLFAPMQAADGWIARIKPPGATLRVDAARVVARASRDYGDGIITLTQRGNVQLRGLSDIDIAPVADMMIEAGLADPDPAIESRRAVIFSPLAGAHPLAVAIETALCRDDLPHKFCVALDVDPRLPLGDVGADITVVCFGTTCAVALAGADNAAELSLPRTTDAVQRLGRVLLQSGARRMRRLVAAVGTRAVFAAAGIRIISLRPVRSPRDVIGWLPDLDAFGVGLPFGRLTAEALLRLATLSAHHGDGTLRTTPWRALLLPKATDPQAIRATADRLGLIIDPADARRRITACIGQPGCASASVDVQTDARKLLGELPEFVHLSGCAKGCAHPAAAPITLVGDAGRYNLIRNGTARSAPVASGITLQDAIALLDPDA